MPSNKFLVKIEENIQRYTNGGKLVGDVVKFVKNYKSKESYKALSDNVKDYIENMIQDQSVTGKNIRCVDVKPMFPSHATGNDQNRGNGFSVEVAFELAPGLFNLQNKVTVPGDLVEPDNDYINLPKADQFTKKEKINHKPVAPEEAEESPYNPYLQTLMSQDGDKLRRTETKLNNVNVTIPSHPAKGASSPEVKGFNKVYKPLPTKIAK
jgi:hypothetical protein